MNLQVKAGQNLTGLKQWFQDGRLSGYAYGEPSDEKTFGNKTVKANCFYQYRTDGFLFRCTPSSDPSNVIPTQIEWIVFARWGGCENPCRSISDTVTERKS